MYQIDLPSAVASLPTPAAPGTPGYFQDENAALGQQGTIVPADFMNMLQAELLNVLAGGGVSPSKTAYNQLLTAIENLAGNAGRTRLTGNTNFYVSPSGSDANNGLSSGAAWLTLQHAANVLTNNYDGAGFTATVNVVNVTPVTLTSGIALSAGFDGTLVFEGNVATPADVVISVTNGNCFTAEPGAQFTVTGMTLTCTGTGSAAGNALLSSGPGLITVGAGIVFGPCGNNHKLSQGPGAGIETPTGGSYTIAGGAMAHSYANFQAGINESNVSVTITGTPAFTTAYVVANNGAGIQSFGNSYSGSATGNSALAEMNGNIQTQAGPVPGNGTVTKLTGGQFA